MELESRIRLMRQTLHAGPALAILLVGLWAATGCVWLLGGGYAATAAVGWFVSWLIIWASLPMIGHAIEP